MPSRRAVRSVFIGLAVAVGAILIAFVYPGFLVVHCTPNYTLTTSHGTRTYCSEQVIVPGPGSEYSGGCQGPSTSVNLASVYFTFQPRYPCVGPVSPIFLNYTIDEGASPTSGTLPPSDSGPTTVVTPDGSAGFVWLTSSGNQSTQQVLVFASQR